MDIKILEQEDRIRFIRDKHGTGPWVTVYKRLDEGAEHGSLYGGFIPKEAVSRSLKSPGWDLTMNDKGSSGFVSYYENGQEKTEYLRHCDHKSGELLVITRSFDGVKPDYKELSEEFRLFHNLYYDRQSEKYLKVLDSGEDQEVAIIKENEICIRLSCLKEYIAAKQIVLALFFDIRCDINKKISDMEKKTLALDIEEKNLKMARNAGNFITGQERAFSRLCGKKLIFPGRIEESGIWPFENQEKHQSFIIGEDERGGYVEYSSDPDGLADYFGGNPDAPHYLTPVFFRKEVFQKYYSKPSLYTVEDSYLHCASLWGVRIDNNLPNYVCVFLGDLGRDLPEDDQRYWRSFNVPPDGTISETYFKRSFLGDFAEPQNEDLIFKNKFESLNSDWKKQFGWPLFLPLAKDDHHLYATLRVPLSNDQAEFDNQILALTKIVIDSLNEKELKKQISIDINDLKGIGKLELFLKEKYFPNYKQLIEFLRNLQMVRSGVGHRKGEKYVKGLKKLGLEDIPSGDSFAQILKETNGFLDEIRAFFINMEESR